MLLIHKKGHQKMVDLRKRLVAGIYYVLSAIVIVIVILLIYHIVLTA
ncbi:MAG: hypothetical protein ABSB40_04965 [Nitrososphaeria archaeon]|jgi:hypothetical protein